MDELNGKKAISKTESSISHLKINILSQENYDQALAAGQIQPNEIYMTPEDRELGTMDHSKLNNRNQSNAHNIDSITDLQETLDGKKNKTIFVTVSNNIPSMYGNEIMSLIEKGEEVKLRDDLNVGFIGDYIGNFDDTCFFTKQFLGRAQTYQVPQKEGEVIVQTQQISADAISSVVPPELPKETAANVQACIDEIAKKPGVPGPAGKSIAWGSLTDPAAASDTHATIANIIQKHTRIAAPVKNPGTFRPGDLALLPGQYNDNPRQHYTMLFEVDKVAGSQLQGYPLNVIEEGLPGQKGDTGAAGAVGPQGPKGGDGAPGKDGAQGPAGPAGAAGKTPVRGVDYWTSADQAKIVQDTLAALPKWNGGGSY